jgi:predicted acylesterase/phospholipase RssA
MTNKIIRILSLDGGGIRAIIPARLLERMEESTGEPAKALFHLIAGTSTGGIVCCGLMKGKAARAMAQLYADRGGEIFQRSVWGKLTTITGLSKPNYDAGPLEAILSQELGDTWLSEVSGAELLIPSYTFEKPGGGAGGPPAPYLFESSKARGVEIDPSDRPADFDFRLRDVARATSAAPTYFPPALVQNRAGAQFEMIDGGMFANNPAMRALVTAFCLYPEAESFMVVSLGTGSRERPIPYAVAKNWGLADWARPILNVLMDGTANTTSYEVDHIPKTSHYRFDISLGADPKQDSQAVNEDFDAAAPDNITRIERKANALANRMADKLQTVIDELKKPKWVPQGDN